MRYSHSLRKYMRDGTHSSAGKQMLEKHIQRTYGSQEVTYVGNKIIVGEGSVMDYNTMLQQAVSSQGMIDNPELNHITEDSMAEVGRRSDRTNHAMNNDKTEYYSAESTSMADGAMASMLSKAGR